MDPALAMNTSNSNVIAKNVVSSDRTIILEGIDLPPYLSWVLKLDLKNR